MKRFTLAIASFLILGLFSLIPYSGGSPGAKTGSPTDGSTCTQCHGGTAITASNWISSSIPEEGYVPGETYTITLKGTHPGVVRFGFELTAEDNTGAKSGIFTITNTTQTKLVNNNKSVTHKAGGLAPDGNSKTWEFDWTAPAEGSGEITFYAALNAANGNNQTSGDNIYKTSLAVSENTSSGIVTTEVEDNLFKVYQTTELNQLFVEYSDSEKTPEAIRVFDLSGKLLITKHIRTFSDDTMVLNIENLSTNIYLVQIQTDAGPLTKKVMINK